MRVGISTASLFNRVPTESAFDVLRQMRVDTTEVFLNTFSEYEKPFADALVARKGTINVHSVHALSTQFEPQLFTANARVRADAENIFKKVCYAGAVLGAKYFTFHGPVRLKDKEYVFDYAKLGDRINQLSEIAQAYGLRISYENVHWTYFNNPDYFRRLKLQCPNLGATLDIKQAMQSGINVYKFLDVMADRLTTVHLCDYNAKGETRIPGQGKFNFEKLFRELDALNINVQMFVEVYTQDYRDLNELKESYDYLAKMLIHVNNR